MVWDIDPILLRVGPARLGYYGICFAASLLGGFYLWRWQMLRGGHPEKRADGFLLLGVLAVAFGARLGHVLFYQPEMIVQDPLRVLNAWQGGLASHGAALGLIAAMTYFARREKMRFAEVADRLSLSIAWGATLVRVGNFFNSEIVGRVTDLPWAVKFPRYDRGLPLDQVPWRHPSQLYEVAIGLLVLLTLFLVDRKLGEKRPAGLLGYLFVTLYFPARFLVEFTKEYQTLEGATSALTMGQYLSIPAIPLGLWGLWRALKSPLPVPRPQAAEEPPGAPRRSVKRPGRKKRRRR
jgi:prolipoprotein diacylglyceryl transferase